MGPDDVKVTVERNVVNVEATFAPPRQEGDEPIIDERPHGRATRQFFLGENLEPANLRANYDRGVLMLTVPVAEQSKPRQIEVARPRNERSMYRQARRKTVSSGRWERGQNAPNLSTPRRRERVMRSIDVWQPATRRPQGDRPIFRRCAA